MAENSTHEQLLERVKTLEMEAARRTEAENALRDSEQLLSQIIQGSPIPTFVIDKGHYVTHYNRACESLTGVNAEDILGTSRQWSAFYLEERPVLADFIVDQAPEQEIVRLYGTRCHRSSVIEGAYEAEGFFQALGQKGRWLFFTAAPLYGQHGEVIGAVETLQDMTDRKRAEEVVRNSERRYRTLLDFVPYPMVAFSLEGKVTYANAAFTETFGWTFQELKGQRIPYVPEGLEKETSEKLQELIRTRLVLRHETKRRTRDGRTLDVVMRGVVFLDDEGEPAGELVILRDITNEKRMTRNNEILHRISIALPEYPDLEELLDYISEEVRHLLGSEGALIILHDEEKKELYALGGAYDDTATERRVKEIRWGMDQLVAGKVIQTGEPMIVTDTSTDPALHQERDKKLGYHTRNLVLVPLRSFDRIIGSLCAINKIEGTFDETDESLLSMIAGTVVLSIENARFSEELKRAYREVSSLNRAKDKVINHLSHELKTPISVLSGSLNVLERRLEDLPEQNWKTTMARARRNLDRITEIEDEVDDIMQGRSHEIYAMMNLLVEQCTDELETLLAEMVGEVQGIARVRRRIEDLFSPREMVARKVLLHDFVSERLPVLRAEFPSREVDISLDVEPVPPILIPVEAIQKIFDGLVKNAVENTPNEGKIEIAVKKEGAGALLRVRDYGVGITADHQRRIFEGFFTTRDTLAYSSKRPFDFNAGGKGADLLRMKIFSERYHFRIDMDSTRCRFLPKEDDVCPSRISDCAYCDSPEDCFNSGGTVFILHFPPAP